MGRIAKYLKPYVLKMFFSNKYVSAQVVHSPTSTTVAAASTQEKALREELRGATADVAAASKIGHLLGERLKLKEIPAVAFVLGRGERYHGKRRALVDSLRDNGVKLI